ncbi:hypothetical protein CGRA01v4_06916 [Colletotrichum graminicola]|uniref:Uncharacterized protein n=1 Tax=Colletotrichum graminicola (strain M1.001 / M2 / FGSC 10212) TaxID=645133 RepID=E3R0P0_COLGM|nr:uncharacterized protein GLRG_11824 [Colletotrichum graminicola M1.001]EFQ36678.1 hypothetical protein GLRG_11824 [Colletotrichum graminicola M1.001]WDK15635.1 hypothetical protein CGRA01v4_06916 [Colletotrichum graminicola]
MSTSGKRKASDSPTGPSKNVKLDILEQEFPNTEERAGFIATKFSKLLRDKTVFPKILDKARIDRKHQFVNRTGDISEYWFNYAVDLMAWCNAMKLVQSGRREWFPWRSVPSSKPEDPSDRAVWFPKFKETQAMLASLSSRERLDNGLALMEEEPQMNRNILGMTSIKLRQAIWDDVFPGQPCVQNRPFEVAVPENFDFGAQVHGDKSEYLQQLPPGIRMAIFLTENLKGTIVKCLVFGYQKNTVDSSWNRTLLAVVYRTAVQWAREAFMTQDRVPISQAFKNLRFSIAHGEVVSSERMKQLSLDKSLVAECDAQLALGPYRNQEDHAVFRVSAWLEKEKLLPADERCRMLRG